LRTYARTNTLVWIRPWPGGIESEPEVTNVSPSELSGCANHDEVPRCTTGPSNSRTNL